MKKAALVVLLVLLGAAGLLAVLFVVQNLARETALSLDLHFAAWQLAQQQPVVLLMGICLLAGLLAGFILGLMASRPRRPPVSPVLDEEPGEESWA